MKVVSGLALVVCAAFLTVTSASGAPAVRAVNSVTFEDSTGEDPLAPDITSIVVSNDDAGLITFQINIPNRPTFSSDMVILVFIDSDANPLTGDGGADYVIDFEQTSAGAIAGLARWDGSRYTFDVPQTTLRSSYASGLTIKISVSEIGSPTRVSFSVVAVSGVAFDDQGNIITANLHRDFAPDPGHGDFPYEVKIKPPTLVVKTFRTVPVKPRAGRTFTVTMVAARSDTGATVQSSSVKCKATLAFKTLPVRTVKAVGDKASCSWLIPKTATGKTLRLTISIEFEGLTAKKNLASKVG